MFFIGIFLVSSSNVGGLSTEETIDTIDDIDPLVDIEVTVDIISIRTLNDSEFCNNTDFFVKVFINSEEYSSPVWDDSPYLYDIHWIATANVPDDIEQVNITIELYDTAMFGANINTHSSNTDLIYNIKTGHWTGDDYIGDSSGYGRLNSCDVENIYCDYELWFKINQTDFDGDGVPYWTEINNYETDPKYDNTGEDLDGDLLPIEWEYTWMFNPNIWENHSQLDIDEDSLTNIEEYYMSAWDSDPYRRDLYVEMDVMETGPLGQNSTVPSHSKELLRTAYDRNNIVYHLDDGCMGGGGEKIPFDQSTDRQELRNIYTSYFLHNDSENWRRSVFRYATIIFNQTVAAAVAYVGEHPWLYWHIHGINTFAISAQSMQKTSQKNSKPLDFIFSCAMMHETGHTFGIDFMFPVGCDNILTSRPYHVAYWFFGNYKSCMNYRYTYSILDYSDGSHGLFDYDDWSGLDFSFFEKNW
ncbi:MAG TPA: hypothetical protein HA260_04985 [Thermoplasmata archaeon]|nr:hypothetical protein [Thermoplasmata archaeon]